MGRPTRSTLRCRKETARGARGPCLVPLKKVRVLSETETAPKYPKHALSRRRPNQRKHPSVRPQLPQVRQFSTAWLAFARSMRCLTQVYRDVGMGK